MKQILVSMPNNSVSLKEMLRIVQMHKAKYERNIKMESLYISICSQIRLKWIFKLTCEEDLKVHGNGILMQFLTFWTLFIILIKLFT
jgi:hypothetical protein